jgi:hypothetical protein
MELYDPDLHLLVDDHDVLYRENLERIVGRPKKYPVPVVKQDRPWESPWVYAWGSVLRHPETDRLQMWYETAGYGNDTALIRTCYAESTDGIHWEKPTLGRYALYGYEDTNIVAMCHARQTDEPRGVQVWAESGACFLGEGPQIHDFASHYDGTNVVRDEQEPDPQKRYKFIGCMWRRDGNGRHSHNVMTSPDGIHWTMPPEKVLEGINDGTTVEWDPIRRKWMLGWLSSKVLDTGENVRFSELAESDDFRNWTLVGKPFDLDAEDGFGRIQQGHFFHPFVYGNQYLALYSAIHSKEGWVQTYLVSSRDGRHWERLLRRDPFIPIGGEGDFDEDSVDTAINSPLLMGDEMFIYYSGRARRLYAPGAASGAIGLVQLKRDRFAGLCNGGWFNRDCNNNVSAGGSLLTKPVTVAGPTLYVNARSMEVSPTWGILRAELLDEAQQPIPGYTLEECLPVRGDGVRLPVRWKEHADVSALQSRQVHIRFQINKTTLYAYTFAS